MSASTANRVIGTAASSGCTLWGKRSPEHSSTMIRASAENVDISPTIARSGSGRAVWAPGLGPRDVRVRRYTTFEVEVTSRLTVVPNRRPWVPSNVAVARDCFFFRNLLLAHRSPRGQTFDSHSLSMYVEDRPTHLEGWQ